MTFDELDDEMRVFETAADYCVCEGPGLADTGGRLVYAACAGA